MKDKKIKKKKDTIRIFGITMSSGNFFALIFLIIWEIIMIFRSRYINEKLSRNTEVFTAEVIDIFLRHPWSTSYEMKYRYYDRGKEKTHDTYLENDEKPYVHVGDCIEIIVSREDNKIQDWDRSKGAFRCPSEGIQRSSDDDKSASGAKDNKGN
jgi:hypothetical protein